MYRARVEVSICRSSRLNSASKNFPMMLHSARPSVKLSTLNSHSNMSLGMISSLLTRERVALAMAESTKVLPAELLMESFRLALLSDLVMCLRASSTSFSRRKELRTLLTIEVAASTTPCAESISMLAKDNITLPVETAGPSVFLWWKFSVWMTTTTAQFVRPTISSSSLGMEDSLCGWASMIRGVGISSSPTCRFSMGTT
mmetsp:Transcript_786/g.1726  ORF Transcript_786/g.1726 Transcript_786/m.1726 type:complete len:201 (-) Transcript_786:2360-2962(-)